MLNDIKGSYSLVIATKKKLVAVRDKFGFRPLVLGSISNGYVVASETCALDSIGAIYIRDIKCGEVLIIDNNGIKSIYTNSEKLKSTCIFEYIYFSNNSSYIDNISVFKSRYESGKQLARENPVTADIVAPVPNSGIPSALGYAHESGIPFKNILIKNKFIGRTFTLPDEKSRTQAVLSKFKINVNDVEGKRIILVDDSIVRGVTTKILVDNLKAYGAKKIHIKISSPPIKYPCYFGIDIPKRGDLLCAYNTIKKACKVIGADSLSYLTFNGLIHSLGGQKEGFCKACLDGEYPIEIEKFNFSHRSK